MSRTFLRLLVCQVPNAVLERELFVNVSNLGQNANFEVGHGEQELRIVLGINTGEGVFPFNGRERTRKSVLDIPEDGSTEIDVVLDETHPAIAWPALLIVVADQILVVRIRIGTQVPLDEVS